MISFQLRHPLGMGQLDVHVVLLSEVPLVEVVFLPGLLFEDALAFQEIVVSLHLLLESEVFHAFVANTELVKFVDSFLVLLANVEGGFQPGTVHRIFGFCSRCR